MFFFVFFSFSLPAEVRTTKINMNGSVGGTKQELVFEDIVVEINKRTILNNVWGSVSSGELMAVMGQVVSLLSILCFFISNSSKLKEKQDMFPSSQWYTVTIT